MKSSHDLAQKLGLNHKQREALIRMEKLQAEMRQKIEAFKSEKRKIASSTLTMAFSRMDIKMDPRFSWVLVVLHITSVVRRLRFKKLI